ncbi:MULTISPECIES: helix-turn-helix transcriptional regulator [unclassified Nocardiopsis]|uniref:helix-turn-helix domain-containing protein n=1 Tax=unclassified Nocardiopsis TaxID=2649073 RepID=UPI001F30E9A8|nr:MULTISPECIES: helix-turn-helix transcriptional regulator [unclassified Nocardiopsis]
MIGAVRERDAQAVVCFLRRRVRSLSQEALARMCGVAQSTITRAEAGRGLTDRRKAMEALRGLGALDAAEDIRDPEQAANTSLAGQPRGVDVQGSAAETIRRLVSTYDLPEDGPVCPIGELQKDVVEIVRCRLNSHYTCLLARLPVLLPELTRALMTAQGADRDHAARLLVQAYRAMDAIADKLGLHDLSARTIQVMLWAAEQTVDEVTRAAAAYVRGETFFCNRDFHPGRLMLERAAQKLSPATPQEWAAYGALHMRAAVLSARGRAFGRAQDHLEEARSSARLTTEGVYTGTAFGPASVRIHEVTLALEAEDPDQALATAAGWSPPRQLPAERASHFYIDVARAQMRVRRPDGALDALTRAWRAAPEHTRLHPRVTTMLTQLSRAGGSPASAARDFAAAAGLTVP